MVKNEKIYIAGHTGLVGSALIRELTAQGYTNFITRTQKELDLRDQQKVNLFFKQEKPDYVFLAAAKVGGIRANELYPAEFIYDNLAIEINTIHAAYTHGVKKLLFLGSSCIYPRDCKQPIKEEYLLSGPLEQTNEWYALAKIAGLKLCKAYHKQYGARFISCMPTNLYGIHDTFHPTNSHVIPALIQKIYQAHITNQSEVTLWGTGTAQRDFLYVDDLAKGVIFLMNTYEEDIPINIGTGHDISIKELAQLIKNSIGYKGAVIFDQHTSDGTPRKVLSVEKINKLGWYAKISLSDGLTKTITWYIKQQNNT